MGGERYRPDPLGFDTPRSSPLFSCHWVLAGAFDTRRELSQAQYRGGARRAMSGSCAARVPVIFKDGRITSNLHKGLYPDK